MSAEFYTVAAAAAIYKLFTESFDAAGLKEANAVSQLSIKCAAACRCAPDALVIRGPATLIYRFIHIASYSLSLASPGGSARCCEIQGERRRDALLKVPLRKSCG
jgi:hypothetical protein